MKAAKKKSKHQGRKKYASHQGRASHLTRHVTIKGWDLDDGRFEYEPTFSAMIHPDKRQTLKEYVLEAPMRWHVEARCMALYGNGSTELFSADMTTGQAIRFRELLCLTDELMADACSTVNPRWIDSKTYIIRPL